MANSWFFSETRIIEHPKGKYVYSYGSRFEGGPLTGGKFDDLFELRTNEIDTFASNRSECLFAGHKVRVVVNSGGEITASNGLEISALEYEGRFIQPRPGSDTFILDTGSEAFMYTLPT